METKRKITLGWAIACIFTASATFLHAGTSPGTLKWRFPAGGSSSAAIASDGTIYIGSDDHNLYALNPDGSQKWQYTAGDKIETTPSIASDGTIYFGAFDGKVYALSSNGSLKWTHQTGFGSNTYPIYFGSCTIGTDGTIYIGDGDIGMNAINSDGTTKWVRYGYAQFMCAPAIGTDGTIYFSDTGGGLFAFNPDGTLKWVNGAGGTYSSPIIGSDGTIYIGELGADAGTFTAINPDGSTKWNYSLNGIQSYSTGAIGSDGTLYISPWGGIIALNPADGTEKWRAYTSGSVEISSPAVAADGTVYIGTQNGWVDAVKSGNAVWGYATGGAINSSPVIATDGTVYIQSTDGYFYALYGSSGPAASPWPSYRKNSRNVANAEIANAVVPTCTPLPACMVAWWKGDGNGNDSWGRNNASVPSGVTYGAAEVGWGFNLTGNTNRILVPDAPQLNFGAGQDFSIEAWIQPQANPGNYADVMTVVSKRYAPNTYTQLGYELFLQSGVLNFQMDDSLTPYVYHNFASGGPDLRDGKFHHVAVTVQRNSTTGGRFYIDGKLVSTFNPTVCPGSLVNTDSLRIGNHPTPGLHAFYKGTIDEVSLYYCALSASQITNIYNASSAGKCLEACTPPPAPLVGWWKGEGNGNDSSWAGNNASVPSGVTYGAAEVGWGFNLTGNTNRILVPDAPQLNFGAGQDFSIEAWIQPQANPGNYADVMTVMSKRYAPNTYTQLGYELFLQGGVLNFQMDDSLTPYVYHNFASGGPDLRDGKFHHVAVTVQRNSTTGGQFYIDGQLVSTFDPTVCPGSLVNTDPLRIGNHPTPGLQAFYKGTIDEVSLYYCALSAGQIMNIYDAGSAGKCLPTCTPPPTGLVGWWKAEGSGNDSSGNGNNASVPTGVIYAPSEVGRGFNLIGNDVLAIAGDHFVFGNTNRILVPDAPQLNFGAGQDFSIEAWIQPQPGFQYSNTLMTLVSKRLIPTSNTQLGYEMFLDGGVLCFQMDDSLTPNVYHNFSAGGPYLCDGLFHHVAVTVQRNSTTGGHFYVDGQLVSTFDPTVCPGSLVTTAPLRIGNHPDPSLIILYNGIIDEVSLYNCALSADQITAVFNASFEGKCTP